MLSSQSAEQGGRINPEAFEDESYLVEALKQGDNTAYKFLVAKYRDKLIAFATVQYTHNADKAEDLVQKTMLKVFENIQSFEGGSNLSNWMHRILKNTFIDEYRKEGRRREDLTGQDPDLGIVEGQQSTFEKVQDKLQMEQLQGILETLSENDRTVFQLYFIDGMKSREIAETLDIPDATVRTRIFNLKKKLINEFKIN